MSKSWFKGLSITFMFIKKNEYVDLGAHMRSVTANTRKDEWAVMLTWVTTLNDLASCKGWGMVLH